MNADEKQIGKTISVRQVYFNYIVPSISLVLVSSLTPLAILVWYIYHPGSVVALTFLVGISLLSILVSFYLFWRSLTIAITDRLQKIVDSMNTIATGSGDLGKTTEHLSGLKAGPFIEIYRSMLERFRQIFIEIMDATSHSIVSGSLMERKLGQLNDNLNVMNQKQEYGIELITDSVNSVRSQYSAIKEIKSMGDSLQQFVFRLNTNITQINEQAVSGRLGLQQSEDHMSELKKSIDDHLYYSKDLVTRLGEIEGVMNSIRDISDKTNLLSLNASIEAARAGNMGHGFAVVADEINKLADQSKNAVDEISVYLATIVQDARKSSEGSNVIADQMNQLHTLVESTVSGLTLILEKIDGIKQNSGHLAEHFQDFNETISSLSGDAENITQNSSKVEGNMFSVLKSSIVVLQEVQNLSENIVSTNQSMEIILKDLKPLSLIRKSDFQKHVEHAREAHLNWLEILGEQLEGEGTIQDLETNSTRCRFGVFYHNSPTPGGCESSWEEVGKLHDDIHESAKHIHDFLSRNKKEEASSFYRETRQKSESMIHLLQDCLENFREAG